MKEDRFIQMLLNLQWGYILIKTIVNWKYPMSKMHLTCLIYTLLYTVECWLFPLVILWWWGAAAHCCCPASREGRITHRHLGRDQNVKYIFYWMCIIFPSSWSKKNCKLIQSKIGTVCIMISFRVYDILEKAKL